MRTCGYCEKSIVWKNAQAKYCSDHCRNYDRRRKARTPYPQQMLERKRWMRWTTVIRNGTPTKKPLKINGHAASSTDPKTWSSYADATASKAGVGLGFVLGNGIGCIDLDHCLSADGPTEAAAHFIADYPENLIEISPSGDGLHIWGLAPEQPGTKRSIDGLSIERYSAGRYITITGNIYQHGHLLPL